MKNTTYAINDEIKNKLVKYKEDLEKNTAQNSKNTDNIYSLQEERRQIKKGWHKIELDLPEFSGDLDLSRAKKDYNTKNEMKYFYKLTYLIHSARFKFHKSFCVFAINKKEAKREGKVRAFSKYLCRFEDVHLRQLKKVRTPTTRSAQLVQEHRCNQQKNKA